MAQDNQAMRIVSTLSSIIALPLLGVIKVYQLLISPMLGQNCRFYPSCSSYAQQALKQHGAFTGSWLAIKRIVKCQPLHPGGIDNVPCNAKHTYCEHAAQQNVINSDRNNTIKNHH